VSQPYRAPDGGLIDRTRTLGFSFDGVAYRGHPGDSLAAALLANGVRVVGRSFKYHRRRGILGIGAEEPNALLNIGAGARRTPNLRATEVELFDGLVATSQNRWPSLRFDIGAANDLLSRFLPAGFYYKTFMWPASWWMRYERVIRAAAGLGRAPELPDPDAYLRRHAHCDLLVIGAGPAGLMAALLGARAGARVVLVDEHAHPGGQLRREAHELDGRPAHLWAETVAGEMRALPNVRVIARATAFGCYDDNLVAVCERISDHLAQPAPGQPRQRVWWLRARHVVLASGALERPLVFPGNDLPGVMLASAAGGYAHQYAVRAGHSAVLFANNDLAYQAVRALHGVGVRVRAVVDPRADGAGDAARQAAVDAGAEILEGHVVCEARGRSGVRSVRVAPYPHGRVAARSRALDCDLLCVSGGWNPTVHLFSQAQGRLRYDEASAAFVPADIARPISVCGAVQGIADLAGCLDSGARAGREACTALGLAIPAVEVPVAAPAPERAPLLPLWEVPRMRRGAAKSFVDFQNDVAADDVRLAARENYRSVEHLKRYTTLGMGTDQGRTSNVNGLAIMAATLGCAIPEVGTTTFRPPYVPVTLSALGGLEVGAHYEPVRRTPLHDWHVEAGARMQNVGLWQRARYYPRAGESMAEAVNREVRHVRGAVGIVDVSTFGKIDVRGRDAAEFLERVTINRFHNLAPGRCRYHLMLREDGFVMDDGTTTRVDTDAFYMTTTTAAAASVMSHLEYHAQTVWPELQVHLSSISDQWGGLAIAGPRARAVLAAAVSGADVSHDALPPMSSIAAHIADVPVRVFRISFSGELGYEVHMPADHTLTVWHAVREEGRAYGVAPYGTEAMAVMRIEKGHVVHAELDGRTIAADFGFERMMRKQGDFIGRRALEREAFAPQHRRRLVGLISESGKPIPAGSQLVWNPTAPLPMHSYGHVSSTCYSPTLERHVALALLEDAPSWQGKTLYALSPLRRRSALVRITGPALVDPEGRRARG
jgi:sarcosine oxidase subunit alpha